jgi:hypothetical protein
MSAATSGVSLSPHIAFAHAGYLLLAARLMQFSRRRAGDDAVLAVTQRQHPPRMPRQIIGKLVKSRQGFGGL